MAVMTHYYRELKLQRIPRINLEAVEKEDGVFILSGCWYAHRYMGDDFYANDELITEKTYYELIKMIENKSSPESIFETLERLENIHASNPSA